MLLQRSAIYDLILKLMVVRKLSSTLYLKLKPKSQEKRVPKMDTLTKCSRNQCKRLRSYINSMLLLQGLIVLNILSTILYLKLEVRFQRTRVESISIMTKLYREVSTRRTHSLCNRKHRVSAKLNIFLQTPRRIDSLLQFRLFQGLMTNWLPFQIHISNHQSRKLKYQTISNKEPLKKLKTKKL